MWMLFTTVLESLLICRTCRTFEVNQTRSLICISSSNIKSEDFEDFHSSFHSELGRDERWRVYPFKQLWYGSCYRLPFFLKERAPHQSWTFPKFYYPLLEAQKSTLHWRQPKAVTDGEYFKCSLQQLESFVGEVAGNVWQSSNMPHTYRMTGGRIRTVNVVQHGHYGHARPDVVCGPLLKNSTKTLKSAQ